MSDPTFYAVIDEEYTLGKDDAEAWQEILVPWSNIVAYSFETIGGATTAFGLIQFSPGALHPYLDLYCNRVMVHPITYTATPGNWNYARVRATFGPQKYDTSNDKHIEIEYDSGGEETPIPASNFTALDDDGNPVALPSDTKDFPRITVVSKLTIKYPFQPNVNPALWTPYIATVNNTVFPSFTASGWGAGQVLMKGLSLSRSTSVQTGGNQYTYGYEFWIREDPQAQWNSLLLDTTGVWTPIYYAQNTSKQPYPTSDLNQLFLGIPDEE